MGNRVGVIFHEDYKAFSPLFYSQNGGYSIHKTYIKEYLDNYRKLYLTKESGYSYDCEYIMYDFIQQVGSGLHNRISMIDCKEIAITHKYENYFDNGCFLVNVSFKNYGKIDVCFG